MHKAWPRSPTCCRRCRSCGAEDLILSLHHNPEINFTEQQTAASLEKTLRTLAGQAADRHITLHLRSRNIPATSQLLDRIGAKNLRLAACLDPSDAAPPSPAVAATLREKVGIWLLAATAQRYCRPAVG